MRYLYNVPSTAAGVGRGVSHQKLQLLILRLLELQTRGQVGSSALGTLSVQCRASNSPVGLDVEPSRARARAVLEEAGTPSEGPRGSCGVSETDVTREAGLGQLNK